MSSYVRVITPTEPLPVPRNLALPVPYELDRFQKFAVEAIELGENVLATCPTGSGKTFVGEYQIAKSLSKGKRVFFTTPIKSLSNQKFHDLKNLFPDASVGIMTGDIKFRPDAQVIVMTTEILRNLLFKKGTLTESVGTTALLSMDDVDAVVFDEVHYINDVDRGHVWEECLILLPPEIKLILLSATLSSPYGFAKWLGETKKVCIWLISTIWRAVPLEHAVFTDKPLAIMQKDVFDPDVYRAWYSARQGVLVAHDKFKEKVKAAVRSGHEGPVSGKVRPKAFEFELNECLNWLDTHTCLPCIVFVFSRTGCETLASKVTNTFLDSSDSALVSHIWDFHLTRYRAVLEKSPQAHALRTLAMRGIAYHHSGLLPFMKEILEILFSKGLIKVLFATETFAVGINMPTKTVVFTALDKYTDGSIRPLKSAEYIQMAGRAGRRGKDDKGLVLYLPQRDPVEVSLIQSILTGKSATFSSRMNFHYDFLLKIGNSHGISMNTLVEGSYWWALEQIQLADVHKEIQLLKDTISHMNLSSEEIAACEDKDSLDVLVATSQNSKKKQAVRNLERWKEEHKDSIWGPILTRWKVHKGAQLQIQQLHKVTEQIGGKLVDSLPNVGARIQTLNTLGYIESGEVLTLKGRLASEVNEAHPFLMTELFLRIDASQIDFLTILAVFLGENKGESNSPDNLSVSKPIKDELWRIDGDAKRARKVEKEFGIEDPDYWTLSTEWVEPVAAWLKGESISSLAETFGLFEGNIQKALMKLASVVEEVQALATIAGNVKMLELLEGCRPLILQDIIIAESLYLRI